MGKQSAPGARYSEARRWVQPLAYLGYACSHLVRIDTELLQRRQFRRCSKRAKAMFILFADWRKGSDDDDTVEIEAMMDAHARYFQYVETNRARFPSSAYELAAARWRHDFNDHRALRDSWVESVKVCNESLLGGEDGNNFLELVTLGAYHDGRIRIRYKGIQSVSFGISDALGGPEIYRDEIRLSESGLVLHEIEFLGRENWLIECEDMEQHWEPI